MPVDIQADSLNRFMQCNGSALMQPSYPPEAEQIDTTIRDEGIAAHEMALSVYRGDFSDPLELVDRRASNGVFYTADMAQHVETYLEFIRQDEYDNESMELDTSFVGVGARADFVGVTSDGRIRIPDFKYGFTIVEPEYNWTLIAHLVGSIRKLGVADVRNMTFELSIIQPRARHHKGPIRVWPVGYDEYVALYSQLRSALDNPKNELRTGPSCYKCPARATCPAYTKAELNAIEASDVMFSENVSNEQLSEAIRMLQRASKVVKQKLESYESLAKHRLRKGEQVGNFALEPTIGNTAWNEGLTPEFVQMLTGVNVAKPGLVTPAQAKKAGINEDVLKTMTYRPSTGVKLIEENATERAKRLLGK